jgi:hypothetical protein
MTDAITLGIREPDPSLVGYQRRFAAVLNYQGRSMRTLHQGAVAVSGGAWRAPDVYEVMQPLLDDAAAVENTTSFAEWATAVGLEASLVERYVHWRFGLRPGVYSEGQLHAEELGFAALDRRGLRRFVPSLAWLDEVPWQTRVRGAAEATRRAQRWVRRRYSAVIQQTTQLRGLLGADYEEFLWGASAGWEAHQGPHPAGLGANSRGLQGRDQIPAGFARLQEMAEREDWDTPSWRRRRFADPAARGLG